MMSYKRSNCKKQFPLNESSVKHHNTAWLRKMSTRKTKDEASRNNDEFTKTWTEWRKHGSANCPIEDMDVDPQTAEDKILKCQESKVLPISKERVNNKLALKASQRSDKGMVDSGVNFSRSSKVKECSIKVDNIQKTLKTTTTQEKKLKPLFIVIHVKNVEVGAIKGVATTPVKIYANKFMVQMETSTTNVSFRVSCHKISSLDMSLDAKPFYIKFNSLIHYLSSTQKSQKSNFAETVVLHLTYEQYVPVDVCDDLKELFGVRLASLKLWPKNENEKVQEVVAKKEMETHVKKATVIKSCLPQLRKRCSPSQMKDQCEETVVRNAAQSKVARKSNECLTDEQMKTLSREVANSQMIISQQRFIIRSLESNLQDDNLLIAGIRSELEDVKQTNREQNDDLVAFTNDLNTERDLVGALESQMESARADVEERDRLLNVKNEAIKVRDEMILELRASQYSSGKRNCCKKFENQLAELHSERDHLSLELQSANVTIENLQALAGNNRSQLDMLQARNQESNSHLAKLRSDFISSQEALVQRSEQVRNLTRECSELRERSTEELKTSNNELLTANRTISQLRAQLITAQQNLQNEQEQLSDVQNELSECRRQLDMQQQIWSDKNTSKDWVIGRGELTITEKVLGVGAWGNVKVGVFRGTEVAVKQIHLLILSPHNRRLFEREMAIASRCRHPCLVQFIGATNDDGTPLFIMELMDTDLRSLLSEQPVGDDDCVLITFDVIRALTYLHGCKPPIVHRDISSSNVLLYRDNEHWKAKLSDYGAANFVRLSMTRHPGALLYAAPEAASMDQTPKLDVYSFGVLFCEIHTRELPVPENRKEQVASMRKLEYKDLVNNCLRRSIESRFSSEQVLLHMQGWVRDTTARKM